jgi:class 3 adenylate cyclase/tetratricopeptide (TPR) repeat protein/DNA-binding XRE family transcriptional regulator
VPSGMRREVHGQNGLMTGDETGFGERLRRYRITAGLTQETLAERTGLSVRGIADLERGARRFPHVDTIRRLAEALQLAPADRAALVAAGQRAGGSVERVPASPLSRTCPRCGRENALAARFCSGCGKPLELACPACGSPADPAARFCQSCGTSLLAPSGASATPPAEQPAPVGATAHPTQPVSAPTDGEHKLATVLFCQLANAGPLAQRLGSEGMLAFLDYFFGQAEAEVRQFEGTISSFLSDGFVALFGVPVAHEDHGRRGVLAALGLQRRLKEPWSPPSASHTADPVQPALRMSLATGLVAVGHLGSGPERRATAAGETTLLAAALQQQTEPGTILISHATARLVTGYVRLEELGPLSLPGTAEPVAAFRVTGVGPRRSPIEGLGARPLSQFVGRDREMSTLHDLLAQVAASSEMDAQRVLSRFIGRDEALAALRGPLAKVEAGHGQVVGMVGEPGIGKSRLLYEFRRSLSAKRLTYLEGRCLSYGSSIPFLPILDLVRANCGIQDGDAPSTVVDKVRFGLHEVGLDPDEHAPYILHLLGVDDDGAALTHLSPEAIKARIGDSLRTWSLAGSQQRPVIFAVEDLHWIDRSSEEYLASLVASLAGAPILLVCTWRPGYRPPWGDHSYVTQLALRRLSPDESLSVVRWVLQSERVPEALAQAILERAEGNPFFLEELARAALEHGEVAAGTRVPDTIQGVLMARMDRLPDTPRRVLQTASVLGREVPLRLLTAIWQDEAPLGPQLQELQRLEFLYAQAGQEPGFVFKHALTQDVAYETLLPGRRRALHVAAGRALETLYADRLDEAYDRLAHHFARSDEAPKAVEYLARFAAKAARIHAHADAARALEEALEHAARLPAEQSERRLVELAVLLAASYYFLGRFRDTVELLEQHRVQVEQLGDPGLAGRLMFELAHAHSHLGNYNQAVDCCERAIAAADQAGDQATQGKAHYVLCKESMWVSRFPEGLEHGRRAVEHLQSTGERWWLGQSLCWQGINLYFMGQLDAALACAGHGFAIGQELGDHRLQSYAAWNHAWFAATRGDGDEAIAWGHRSIGLSPDPLNNAFSLGWTGYAYLEGGDAERAIQLLEQSIELLAGMRYSRLVGWFKGWLAEAYLLKGDAAHAATEAQLGLEISRTTGFTWAVGLAQRALGSIARTRGQDGAAEAQLSESLATFEAIQSCLDAGRSHLALAELLRAQGEPEQAAEHVEAARKQFAAVGASTYLARLEPLDAR